MPTPGQPAQALHDCSPQAWRPRAGGFLGLYVSRWACGPAGFGDSFLSFHFLAFGTAPWALGAQHPSGAWRRGVHPQGQAWGSGRWAISPPRTAIPSAVPWQCAVSSQSPRPREACVTAEFPRRLRCGWSRALREGSSVWPPRASGLGASCALSALCILFQCREPRTPAGNPQALGTPSQAWRMRQSPCALGVQG